MVENSFRKMIKSIRSNKGGEYFKRDFQYYCESGGIQMEHLVPYTPQHNGVAKRKKTSLKEMETCLIHAKHIPPSLWAEEVNCASYCRIGCPIIQLVGSLHSKHCMGISPMSLI